MTDRIAVNVPRLRDEFLDLVRIASVSKREGAIARRLQEILVGMGATVDIDDAGPRVGADTGNLLARFPGTMPDAAPFLLCAHMDTVVPGENIRPVVAAIQERAGYPGATGLAAWSTGRSPARSRASRRATPRFRPST